MSKENNTKTDAEKALEYLEEAWAYYTPVPAIVINNREPELFEYANAA